MLGPVINAAVGIQKAFYFAYVFIENSIFKPIEQFIVIKKTKFLCGCGKASHLATLICQTAANRGG